MGRFRPPAMSNPAPANDVTPASRSLDLNSHPVSLLWAHQLRREHAGLLSRIEKLVDTVGNVRHDVEKAVASAKQAGDGVIGVKGESERVRKEFVRLQGRLGTVEDHVESFEGVSGDVEGLLSQLEAVKGSVEGVKGEVRSAVNGSASKSEVSMLTKKVDAVEKQIMDLVARRKEDDVVLVKDSMEGLGRLMNKNSVKHALGPRQSPHQPRTNRQRNGSPLLGSYDKNPQDMTMPDEREQDTDRLPTMNDKTTPAIQMPGSSYIVGDIDLDEHVHTISYAGHNFNRGRKLPEDSLVMLAEFDPLRTPPTKNIGDLEQDRFQTWEIYLAEGQAAIDALPKRKEGAAVENFVSGIYDQERMGDCERWLDRRGWTWENVRAFDDHLGEVETQDGVPEEIGPELLVETVNKQTQTIIATIPKDSCTNNHQQTQTTKVTQCKEGFGQNIRSTRKAVTKMSNLKELLKEFPVIPRRSERISQKQVETQESGQIQSQLRSRPQKSAGQNRKRAVELPPSYQPPRQLRQTNKTQLPIPKPTLKPMLALKVEAVGPETLATSPDQLLLRSPDEQELYILPPMPMKVPAKRSALPPQDVSILPPGPQAQNGVRPRKRKIDYNGHVVRSEQSESLAFDDVASAELGFTQAMGEVEAGVLRLLKKSKTNQKAVAESDIKKAKAKTPGQGTVRAPLGARGNQVAAAKACDFGKGGDDDETGTVLLGLLDRPGIGLAVESIERHGEGHENANMQRLRLLPKKTMPKLTNKTAEKSKEKRARESGGGGRGGWGGVSRLPPEIPILPSTPSSQEVA